MLGNSEVDRPNIVVVMSDQHNKHVTGCYGDSVVSTPNIDGLASDGVVFDNACCPFPLCAPSRMAFMTGTMPSSLRMYDNSCVLRSDEPTFAHALGRSGYEMVLCGRMHFNGLDQRHGFGKRIFPEVSTYGIGTLSGTNGFSRISLEKSGPGRNPYLLYDEQCVAQATGWLRDRRQADGAGPFCMVVGLVGPHCPFVCPPDLFDKYFYCEAFNVPVCDDQHVRGMGAYNRRFRQRSNIHDATEHEIRRTRAAYYGMVEFDDMLVGQVISALEEARLIDNTVIIYVSDHGEMAGEHGLWWKMSFYEGSVGVPMIVSMPGRAGGGLRVTTPVSLIDLAPTLAEIGGAEALAEIDGRSLTGHLDGQDIDSDGAVFSELFVDVGWKDWGPSGGPGRMLRKGKWKCIYYHGEEPELYDLEADGAEMVDRSRDPACKEILDAMLSEILSGWDADALQADMERLARKRAVVGDMPIDSPGLRGEYWKGPKDYGAVNPV